MPEDWAKAMGIPRAGTDEMSNRTWNEIDIINVCSETQPMNADEIQAALKISPYDKRECYRLSEALRDLGNSGRLLRDKTSQTYRKPRTTPA